MEDVEGPAIRAGVVVVLTIMRMDSGPWGEVGEGMGGHTVVEWQAGGAAFSVAVCMVDLSDGAAWQLSGGCGLTS